MSRFDSSVAAMVNHHALFAVKVKLFFAAITLRWDRYDILKEHRRIIERRESRLGEGARSKAKAEQVEALPFPEAV